MSMDYWGVVMRGIKDADLNWKDNEEGLWMLTEELDTQEVTVNLSNGKKVPLGIELTEDDDFIGFYSCYPWDEYSKGLEEKDVDDALVQFLLPYVNDTEKEIRDKISYINTYNCC